MTRVPEDFHTITPQLVVSGVGAAIEWYTTALGANELLRNTAPDGTSIMHSELLLGDSRFFVVDEFPGSMQSPASLGGSPITLHLYVKDVDALFDRAVAAGADVLMPVADQFWGDRYGMLRDPFGHRWSIASRIEDLSPKALQQRAAAWASRRARLVRHRARLDLRSHHDRRPVDRTGASGRRHRIAMGQMPLWLLWYAEQPWPGALVVKQLVFELMSALLLGLTIAALGKRAASS